METRELKEIAEALAKPFPRGDWTDEYFASMRAGTFFSRHLHDGTQKQISFIERWLVFLKPKMAEEDFATNLPYVHVVRNMLVHFLDLSSRGKLDEYSGDVDTVHTQLSEVCGRLAFHKQDYFSDLRKVLLKHIKNNHNMLVEYLNKVEDDGVQMSAVLGIEIKKVPNAQVFSDHIDKLLSDEMLMRVLKLEDFQRDSSLRLLLDLALSLKK